MTTKRTGLFAATILGGALLLGSAGLALAQDPTSTPSASPATGTPGGMMGGRGGQGGMMGGRGGMGAEDVAAMHAGMVAMHAGMENSGTCDPALMQSLTRRSDPGR